MFADPQSVTVNAVAKTLPLTSREGMESIYTESTGEHQLKVSHQLASRNRRVVRLDHEKVAADPLTAVNATVSTSVYIVIDEPLWGYTDAEVNYLVQALTLWLSSANVLKVLGGES